MYYHKQISDKADVSRWDPSRSHAQLGFAHLLHPNYKKLLEDSTQLKMVADIAASTIAQAHNTGAIAHNFIDDLLQHCHFTIQDIGYKSKTIDGLADLVDGGTRNVIVVLGCQTLKMLYARVDAAFRVIRRLGAGFDVVLAGGNPKGGNGRTVIINEASEMHIYADSLLERDASVRERINLRLWTEPFSADTEGNIKQFFQSDILSSRPTRVFLVSSTFHLMRVAAGLESHSEIVRERHISDIILIGSEKPFEDDSIKNLPNYVRSLVFEVYLDVLRGGIDRNTQAETL